MGKEAAMLQEILIAIMLCALQVGAVYAFGRRPLEQERE